MNIAPSLSAQQNFALWGFVGYLAVFATIALVVGILGAAQRRRSPDQLHDNE